MIAMGTLSSAGIQRPCKDSDVGPVMSEIEKGGSQEEKERTR